MIDDSQLIPQVLSQGLVGQEDLSRAIQFAADEGTTLFNALITHRLADEHAVVRVVSELINVPSVHLRERLLERDIAQMIPASLAIRNRALPLKVIDEAEQKILVLAMADPIDVLAMDEIASHTGVNIRPVLVGPVDLDEALARLYKSNDESVAAAVDDIFAELEEISSADFDVPEKSHSSSGPSEDSWAALFDEGNQKNDESSMEESSVISQEMRDRPLSDVFEAVSPEQADFAKANKGDALREVDAELSASQRMGGAGMSLEKWDLDEAFTDGEDGNKEEKPAPLSGALKGKASSRLKNSLAALKSPRDKVKPGSSQIGKIKPKQINAATGEDVGQDEVDEVPLPTQESGMNAGMATVVADGVAGRSDVAGPQKDGAPMTREIEADDFFSFAFEGDSPQGLEENTATAAGEQVDLLKEQTLAPRKQAFRLDDHRKETTKLDAITPSKMFFPNRKKEPVLPAHISPEVLFSAALRLLIKKGILDLDDILEEAKKGE